MEKSVIFLKKLMTSEKIRYSNGWKVGCHNFLMFLCFCVFLSNLITIAQVDKFWKWGGTEYLLNWYYRAPKSLV